MDRIEKIEGERKYILVYMDADGNIVDSAKATKFISREEDMQGNLLNETFGIVNKDAVLDDTDDMIYVSNEDYEYFKNFYGNGQYGVDFSKFKIRDK